MRVLTITIKHDWKSSFKSSALKAIAGVEKGAYQGEYLNFSSPELFFGKLTARRWAMIGAMQGAKVMGVRELARILERDVRRVHDDVGVLIELGLIEKTADRKLVCPYSDIHVDMHMLAA